MDAKSRHKFDYCYFILFLIVITIFIFSLFNYETLYAQQQRTQVKTDTSKTTLPDTISAKKIPLAKLKLDTLIQDAFKIFCGHNVFNNFSKLFSIDWIKIYVVKSAY